ncbi:HTH-type transcriptional regulator ArgP [Comamonas aquatica]|uniref:HTH-type transcriptional regulator ArgP n=1 Tax=Comamonas aquatica TaxID=225991 RepID=UPI001B389E23|nr:HTH-type transcriptional regulator ArgP [Comamonas aquatica]QTX21756.1 HTH-type transcriptional regulator ArgP [Comamonas aquatica]
MLDYAGLEALAAVLREGSFDRAARKLHVTPSAISQRIKLLEERLGQVLVMRGAPCTGTEAGRRLCLHVEQVALLENELRRNNPELVPEGQVARPTLKLAVNADSLNSWFVDAMAAFTQEGNELLDISIDDQDHTAKRIKEGEVMAAVTASSSHITGCNIWPLANMQYVAAASPAFIARYFGAQGINAQTLSQAPVLTYDRKDAMQDKWLHQQGVSARHAPPRHWVPSAHAFVRACEAGVAWGMHPTVLIREHLVNGSLVELLPGSGIPVPLYWAHARNAQTGLERLTQCVINAAQAWLEPIDPKP